ncbi:hypothetical protein AgCh_032828 [Apium graveolens]
MVSCLNYCLKAFGFVQLHKYMIDIVKDYELLDAKSSCIPMEQHHVLWGDTTSQFLINVSSYRRLVGRLIYLTITRPDLSYPVHVLAQFMTTARESHWFAALKVVKYIKDWASCPSTRLSLTGFCVLLGDSLVTWKCKKQQIISRSSAEAEYRALADTCCELTWIVSLLTEMQFSDLTPIQLFCDNKSALHIASNPVFHERTKHIEIDCHLVRQKLQTGLIATQHVASVNQPADVFTKALASSQLHYLLSKLGVCDYSLTLTCRGMLQECPMYTTMGSIGLRDLVRVSSTIQLALHVEDPKGNVVDSAALALKLLNDVRVDAIIGPQKSIQASFVIDLGDRAHVPVISFSATSPSLFRRTPYFIQTAQSDATQVGAIASIFKKFQWREAVVIFEDTDYGHGMIPYLANEFYDNDVRLSYRSIIPLHPTEDFILKELYKMMTMQTRVYVVHMSRPLAARLFLKAQELGMMSEGYAWIVSSGIMDMMSSLDSLVVESMQGVLGVKPQIPESENLNSFSHRLEQNFFRNASNVKKETNLSFIGLWAYDTLWALSLAAERVGYSDSIFSKYSACNINLTNLFDLKISESGPKILQEMLLTRFKGLSSEFSLVDGQVEPSSYQILNVVGGGAREVGTWSPAPGLSRTLSESGKTYQVSEDLWGVIWPGESTHIPRGWEINVGGKKLKIGVPVKDGFTEFVRAERDPQTNSTTASGYYIDLFDSVVKVLPYSVKYEYVPFLIGIDGSYNDFVHQVFLQKFDAAVGDITITTNRSLYVDFTMPISEGGVSMIVPITYEDSNNKWTFLKPLKKDLWLTSIAFFIFTGFAVWVLEHRINTAFRGPPSQHVGMICWFPLSTLVFAHREKIMSNFARLVVVVWIFVVLILSSTYTASLSSRLTVQRLRPSYTDVEELIKNGNNVGYQEGSFIASLLKGLGFEESK